jgi:putative heme-binding domain-containing protein
MFGFSLLWCANVVQFSSLSAQQDDSWEGDFKAKTVSGRRSFNSTCAGCHGLDGSGSDKAPNIASNAKVQKLSDVQLSNIISNGVPSNGMPAFPTLTKEQVHALVAHVRVLQGKNEARALPGDAARGKGIFFGKGNCSTCHAISGEGGFLGPDLSAYGSEITAKAIREAIVSSNRVEPAGYRSGAVTTRDGNRFEGVIRNEDNFSIQLQTRDGSFHFLQKSELQNVEHMRRSPMATNYMERAI